MAHHFGAPRFLTVDRGVANRGRLAELVNSQGIYLRFAGKEAAHQIGRCERHGGILKEMVSHAVQSRNVVGGQHMRMVVSGMLLCQEQQDQQRRFFSKSMGVGKNASGDLLIDH